MGPYRDTLLAGGDDSSESSPIRLQIAGFRILSYEGETARVDIALRGSSSGTTVTASAVYELIWEGGDWKINANVPSPVDSDSIPDISGYIPWEA
ncbi:MAG: hypothetical protein ACRCSP_06965 [Rhodoglobus sp.]